MAAHRGDLSCVVTTAKVHILSLKKNVWKRDEIKIKIATDNSQVL